MMKFYQFYQQQNGRIQIWWFNMPNKIKYTTTPTANTIKVVNFVLGIVTGVTYAPTSTTSFYNGYDVPSGGYVVYQNKEVNI